MKADEVAALVDSKEMKFEAAAAYFGDRVPVTPAQYYRLAPKWRSLAFTVSGYTAAQILNKFYEEVQAAVEDGITLSEFKGNMNEFLEAEGYAGLKPAQADTIFINNVQTAYNVGHYERMTDPIVLEMRPYWQYEAVGDIRTRPSHLAMSGRVFPADSPVWDVWFPPNGHHCRCTVRSLTARQVKERGLSVEEKPPSRVELPDGRVVGIFPDRKFAHNPAKTRFEPDMEGYPASLVNAFKKREEKNRQE